jgi:hypothetical protein
MTPAEYLAAGFTETQADALIRRDEAFDREQRALFGHMAATLDAILVEMRRGFEGVTDRLDGLDDRLGRVETRVNSIDDRLGRVEARVNSIDDRLGLVEAHLRDSPGRN